VPYRPPIHKPVVFRSRKRQKEDAAAARRNARPYLTRNWRALRAYILQRDSYRCQIASEICTVYADTVDHIVERSRGGEDVPANLRACCRACHNRRHPDKGGAWP